MGENQLAEDGSTQGVAMFWVFEKGIGSTSWTMIDQPSSAPVLATILILFGIGYTIDYNSRWKLLEVGKKLIIILLT